MGARLRPLLPHRRLKLEALSGRSFLMDASTELYQFLALIRTPTGEPLRDGRGNITSHLLGLLSRASRLARDYSMGLIYVFDGPPNPLKARALDKRRRAREEALSEWRRLLGAGEQAKAWSKAVASAALNEQIVSDAKKLLSLMGLPVLQAPEEAEAQAAYLAAKGVAWAVGTKDFDALLYGAPRQVRYLTLTGAEWLPSRGVALRLQPELFELQEALGKLRISREQLVDVALLMGTDYNAGLWGIGPRRALELIRRYGSLEGLPQALLKELGEEAFRARQAYLRPKVAELEIPEPRPPEERELVDFLCGQRGFSRPRVMEAIARLREAWAARRAWGPA